MTNNEMLFNEIMTAMHKNKMHVFVGWRVLSLLLRQNQQTSWRRRQNSALAIVLKVSFKSPRDAKNIFIAKCQVIFLGDICSVGGSSNSASAGGIIWTTARKFVASIPPVDGRTDDHEKRAAPPPVSGERVTSAGGRINDVGLSTSSQKLHMEYYAPNNLRLRRRRPWPWPCYP